MKTKNEKTQEQKPGIIGQMYEERKSNRLGVLESRDEKFRTLMMRDKEGKSFNINYSTFRSNWRKYNGEELIQTSTQITEQKAEKEKKAERNKETVERKSEVVKITTEDKIKIIKATKGVVEDKIKAVGLELKVEKTSKGGVSVKNGKTTMFEVWSKFNMDKFDIFFRDVVAEGVNVTDIAKNHNAEYTPHDTWSLKHGFRVDKANLDSLLDALVSVVNVYITNKNKKQEEE